MKLYLARWDFAETGGNIHGWFSRSPESAAAWAFRDVVEVHACEFNQNGVTIASAAGGTHTLRNFAIESRSDGKLVLACYAPFVTVDLPLPSRGK
jgi:hypothetical protein